MMKFRYEFLFVEMSEKRQEKSFVHVKMSM